MIVRLVAAAALAGAAMPASAMAADAPVVAVEGGRIAGERLADGRTIFRAVPFAAPPVGPLRWRPPAAVPQWQGVRAARGAAPSCAQLDDGWNKANADGSTEDCLYLEIGTPALKPATPLPVLVWIHGGSNKAGGGAGTVQSSLAKRGIVLVSVQYRLGPLGFMAHRALTAESPDHASGNYGLMDQQAALRWVRRNIAAFGGDPARVTIGGESAGAQDVGLQQVSPLAAGLFAGAIEESGTAGFGWPTRDLATSEAIGDEIATLAGAPAATADALRALPADRLLTAARRIHTPNGLPEPGTVWLQTTIDGHVITEPPAITLARGAGARVPLLIGANAREIGFYDDAATARAALARAYPGHGAEAAQLYGLAGATLPADDPVFGPATLHAATDVVFTCPTSLVATARTRAGVPVWRYRFGYGATVSHASELRYVFGNPGEQGIPADAAPLQAYWANFIRAGDPNGAGLVRWDGHGPSGRYLAFAPTGAGMRQDGGTAPCSWAVYP
ncbi:MULTISPECIES: carboxylesterase family protein [unclassified Sphingomonas]|uniref:carboxylesterase/lipase family protein n=1 Tax=unclassified Sphingomonas TaxID=196159 RepID=UPI00226A3134|nr:MULTISPECIES: carboxylesterase family protein [unclassified Sphingomonas]